MDSYTSTSTTRLCPLLFLIDRNYLPGCLKSICKIFADDTSLFLKATDFNNNLLEISKWAYQWKMLLNSGIIKEETDVYLYQRCEKNFEFL